MTRRYCSDVRDHLIEVVRGLRGLTRAGVSDMLFASTLRRRVVGLVIDLPPHDDGEGRFQGPALPGFMDTRLGNEIISMNGGFRCLSCGYFEPIPKVTAKSWLKVCPNCGGANIRVIEEKVGVLKRLFLRKKAPQAGTSDLSTKESGRPASDDVDELLRQSPDPRRTYLLQVLLNLPPEDALRLVKAAVSRQPDHDLVKFVFGDEGIEMEFDHRNYAEADVQWAEQVFNVAREAEVKARSRRFREALPLLKRALRMSPGHDLLLLTLGVCYAELGELGTAIRILERAHHLYPSNSRIRRNLDALRSAAR